MHVDDIARNAPLIFHARVVGGVHYGYMNTEELGHVPGGIFV